MGSFFKTRLFWIALGVVVCHGDAYFAVID